MPANLSIMLHVHAVFVLLLSSVSMCTAMQYTGHTHHSLDKLKQHN
jgi:hypothetical protein